MVLDSSAIIAILRLEPEASDLARRIEADPVRLIAAPTLLECGIVLEARYGPEGGHSLDLLVYKSGMDVVSFAADHLAVARDAYRRFGKGRHAAGLNFGDCMAYALAKVTGEPLLYVGEDFSKTDIAGVIPSVR